MYIPDISARRVAPSGLVRPSGDLNQQQIVQFQTALYTLGHIPAGAITSAMPIATQAQLLSFQRNYNAENRCRRHEAGATCQSGRVYGAPYSPARIAEDGRWSNETQAALTNYLPFAASAIRQQAASQTPAAPSSTDVMGWGSGPGPDPVGITPVKTPTSLAPRPTTTPSTTTQHAPAAPAPAPPAGTQQTASKFPTGPVVAVGVGIAVIGLAVAYKRSQRKGR